MSSLISSDERRESSFHCEDNLFVEIFFTVKLILTEPKKLTLLTVVSLFPISIVFMQHCSNTYLDLPKWTL